ncbi:MAG: 50S ribosomal protein L9 [Magnetococcales bacterium]|nr:50S ribosomal protein L9 [Magnetococcales bacterium]
MEVILLEKIGKLGDLGDMVRVRGGFGRNFLIPLGKALPASKENRAIFDARRAEYEKRQQEILDVAEVLSEKISGISVVLDRPAGATEKLFGSVTNADIAAFFRQHDVEIVRSIIDIPQPIRTLGEHIVRVRLHPDVIPEITVKVERTVSR